MPTQPAPLSAISTTDAALSIPLLLQPEVGGLVDPLSVNRPNQSSRSLLFVDGGVADYQMLVAGVSSGTEVHILDSSQDAVTQITNTLLGRSGISSLHIVSHGEAGGLDFGTGKLNLSDLPEYAAQLQSWGKALTDDADILLYGCNVAQGELGKAFTSILSQLTGADVAASIDLTGSSALGGDWELEVNTGAIESSLAFRSETIASYNAILPVFAGPVNGYIAEDTTFQSINLVPGAAGVQVFAPLSNDDDSTFTFDLGSNVFRYNGVNYTGTQMSITTNGGISFAGGTAIRPLNNDWVTFVNSSPDDLVLYQYQDLNSDLINDRLIVEWSDVSPFSNTGAGTVTFQAILQINSGSTDGNIVFNYPDLVLSSGDSEGVTSAVSVGALTIKSFGASSPYVGTGKAILISRNPSASLDLNGAASGAGYSTTFNEGDGAVAVVDSNNLTLTDDGTTIASATVTLSNRPNGTTESLTANAGATGIVVNYNPSTGALTLSGTSSIANYEQVLRTVTYNNTSLNPSTTPRTINFVVNDGITNSATVTSTVNVTAVNNAPTVTAPSAIAVTEDISTTLTGISFADPDAGNGIVTATLTVGAGTLGATSGGGVTVGGTATNRTLNGTLAAINSFITGNNLTYITDLNATANQTLSVSLNDGGNTGTGGPLTSAVTNVALNVTAVNDAPTITAPAAIAVTEDVTTTLTGITFADADAGDGSVTATLTVGAGTLGATNGGGVTVGGTATNRTVSGTLAALNSFIAGNNLTYTTDLNATANQTLSVSLNDGGNTGGEALSSTANVALNVTAVNDAPTVTAPAAIAVAEDVTTTLSGISFADVDAGDGIVIASLSVGAGTLAATTGSDVTVGGTATNLTLSGTLAAINSFIAGNNLTYTTDLNATANQTLSVSLNDGGNTGGEALSSTANVALNVTAVNDAPTVTAPSAIAVAEDVTTTLTGISFADVDAGNGSVTATLTVGAGTLAATTGGGVTVGGTATNRTLSGTLAAINSFMAGNNLTYTTSLNATANQTLSVSLNDGGNTGGEALSSTANVALNVTAVNDAPTVTAPSAIAVSEDVTTTLTGISFADVDAGNGSVTATLSVGAGTLAATTGGGVTVGGTATNRTLTGTLAAINSFMAGNNLTYTTALNDATTQTLSVSLNDNGNTGTGGPLASAVTTVTLNVAGTTNLLWRNGTTGTAPTGTGQNAVWQLKDFTRQNDYYIPAVADLNWQIVSTADFNRDGNADILWRNGATGENSVWLMNSTGFQTSYYLPPVADANWRIIATDDFTGDGTADLVWRNQATGENSIWQMNSTGFQTSYYINPVADANWQIVSTADFNADGIADLLWRNRATGENSIWQLNSTGFQTSYYINPVGDANWQVVGTADMNNDGIADIVWRNRATGENSLWQMNSTGLQTSYYINPVADANWQIVGVANLGGNSTPDLLWRNAATGQTDIWQLSEFSFVQSYQLPTAASEWSVRPFTAA